MKRILLSLLVVAGATALPAQGVKNTKHDLSLATGKSDVAYIPLEKRP